MTNALKIDPEITRDTQSSTSLPLPMLWNDVRTSEKTRVPRVRHSIASQGASTWSLPATFIWTDNLNAGNFTPESGITLGEFVERIYLPYLNEKRASTKKGYEEIWNNHIPNRVGQVQLRKFRTVNASRMLEAIADEKT